MPPPLKPPANRGLSLIEVVIAIMILSIGILAAYRSLNQATRQIGGETARVLAATAARNRAEELALVGAAAGRSLPNFIEMGPFRWRVRVDEAATSVGLIEETIRLTSTDQPGAVLVTYVPAEAGK